MSQVLQSKHRVLILGSGGREAAIYRKLEESASIEYLAALPGNGGMANCLSGDVNDIPHIIGVVKEQNINLVVVGPEAPLCDGIVDTFRGQMPAVKVFGPDKNSARLEGSKIFSQRFMVEAGIPVAKGTECYNKEETLQALESHPLPIVIKADGLAAGKGVSIHNDRDSAREKVVELFDDNILGEAGKSILLQEHLTGTEASLFAICNGSDALILPTARDYKRAMENHSGPNTGGMGSYSPGEHLSDEHIGFVRRQIIQPVLDKFSYTGILYVGLMVHSDRADDLSVIEFNCRLGDPETQCVLPRLEGDLLPYLLWACGEDLPVMRVREAQYDRLPAKPECSINVVIAAKGYPGSYDKGIEIRLPEEMPNDVHIIHAGTRAADDKHKFFSTGGRILNIVSLDRSPATAREKVYSFIDSWKSKQNFENLHYRKDIGIN